MWRVVCGITMPSNSQNADINIVAAPRRPPPDSKFCGKTFRSRRPPYCTCVIVENKIKIEEYTTTFTKLMSKRYPTCKPADSAGYFKRFPFAVHMYLENSENAKPRQSRQPNVIGFLNPADSAENMAVSMPALIFGNSKINERP